MISSISMAYLRSPRYFFALPTSSVVRSSSLHCSLNTRFFATRPAKDGTSQPRPPHIFPQHKSNPSTISSSPPLRSLAASGGGNSSSLTGSLSPRVFVNHSIYKGKAALSIHPKAPEFISLASGSFKVGREGSVLLTFAPASGLRQYDWNRKQIFSLSVAEIGTLLSLGAKESCEFYHDTFKGKSDEGKVKKILKIDPFPDGSGRFFNLSVHNQLLNVNESVHLPVAKSEFAVLASTFNFILPHLLGWNMFTSSIKLERQGWMNNAAPKSNANLEWER